MKKLVATTYLLVFPFGAAEEEEKDMLRYLEATFGSLGHILGNLEATLGALEGILGGLGGLLGSSWVVLGWSWGVLGRSWGGPGEVLGGLVAILRRHLEQSNFGSFF